MTKKLVVQTPQKGQVRKGRAIVKSKGHSETKTDSALLEPYNWGPEGEPQGKPMKYVPGQGWFVGD